MAELVSFETRDASMALLLRQWLTKEHTRTIGSNIFVEGNFELCSFCALDSYRLTTFFCYNLQGHVLQLRIAVSLSSNDFILYIG